MVRVGESGTVLARARTRPFDVQPRHMYIAPRKPCRRSYASLADGRIPTGQTPLTEFFLHQGARMYAFASRSSRFRGDGSF